MPMTASQLVDMHTDLTRRTDDNTFARYLATCFTSSHDVYNRAMIIKDAEWAINAHMRHIQHSYLYRVTADMMQVLLHAAAVLDSSDEFDHHLAPTSSGMVRFDVPLDVDDIRQRKLKAHWLVWGPANREGEPVTMMTWYNDSTDPDDYSLDFFQADASNAQIAAATKAIGRWMWLGSEYRADGVPLGDEKFPLSSELKARVIADGQVPSEESTNLPRYVHALWLLLNQTITVVKEEQADRPASKRAKRMNLPSRVTTIQLRRAKYSKQPGETAVEWQHRWIVRGHWRWQACGAGRKERRRIWIAPFVKGPEDAPLIDRPKLYSLER